MRESIVNVLHWLFPSTSQLGAGDYVFMLGGALSWLASFVGWNRGWTWRYAPVLYFMIVGGIVPLLWSTTPALSLGEAAGRVAVYTGLGWAVWVLALLDTTRE